MTAIRRGHNGNSGPFFRAKRPISTVPSKFLLEPLEPRVLLSADAVVSGFAANLEQGAGAVAAEMQQFISSDTIFDSVFPGILETQGEGENAVEISPTLAQTLDVRTDVDPGSKKGAGGIGGAFYYVGGGTAQDRSDFILDLPSNVLLSDAGRDERALDAMDVNQDGSVQWQEAFNVLVLGPISDYLASTTITDQDSSGTVTPADLGIQFNSFLNTFDIPAFLTDRFDFSLASTNISNDADLKWDLDLTLSFDRDDTLYLGYESEDLAIATDPVLPGSAASPTTLRVDAGIHFKSLIIGFVDAMDGAVSAGDFVFAAPDKPSDASDGVSISFEIDDSNSIDAAGNPITRSFELNVGFLGADVTNGKFLVDMDAFGAANDPSNPDALGFTLTQQGTPQSSGTITAGAFPEAGDFVLASDVIFTLKIGTQAFSPVREITLLESATTGNTSLADLIGQLDSAISSASSLFGSLITTSDAGGKIQLSLPTVDPTPAGFGHEMVGADSVTGIAAPVVGSETPGIISFLLSVSGFAPRLVSFTPGVEDHDADGGTPSQVTISTLVSSLNTALAAAGLGSVSASDAGGNKVKLSRPGTLEITRTLTLDTVDEITPDELNSTQIFSASANSASQFLVDLTVVTEGGLENPDDSAFAPTGTIKFDFNPFDSTKLSTVIVDVNPVTGQNVVRANFALTDKDGKALASPASGSDMQPLLDFNVITTAELLGLINQVGNWLGRLSASELLNKFDIPFADLSLGDLLDFKDLVSDTLLINDGDDGLQAGGSTNDVSRLLQWVKINGQDQIAARFGTAQEFEDRLAQVLADLGMYADKPAALLGVDGSYDTATRELTYNLNLDHVFISQQVPLDFDMDLGPIGGVEVNGSVKLEATGHFNWTMGVVMGNAAAALTDGSSLLELNGGAGVAINDHLALTTLGVIKPIYGRLSADANFTLTTIKTGVLNPIVTNISITKAATANNTTLDDLVGDINATLGGTGIAASHDGDRILLKATDATVTNFQITSSSGDAAFTELGLQPEAAATVSLVAPAQAAKAAPDADLSFTLAIHQGVSTTTAAISVPTSATAGNLIIDDLVADINAAMQALSITSVVASHAYGFLVFSAVKSDVDAISITPTGSATAAVQAGLDLAAAKQRLKDIGVDSAAADAITKLTAGISVRGNASPSDPFGRLSADASFTINGTTVGLSKAATAGNSSVADLVKDFNEALNATTLKGKIIAENDGFKIRLRTLDTSITSIDLAGLGTTEAKEIGLADGSYVRSLALQANKSAPLSYGVTSQAKFDVTIVGGTHAGTKSIVIEPDYTINNQSVYDLAATINSALNAAFLGASNNPLVATIQNGQIVIGLKIGNGLGSALFDISPPTIENNLATVAQGITSFSITPTTTAAQDQLQLSTAVGVARTASATDFLIYTRDGGVHSVSLDSLRDPDLTHAPKLVGTIAQLKTLISTATGGKVSVELANDSSSLKLVDISLPGDTDFSNDPGVLKVVAVNGSPAAIQLGIMGSDTSQLNLGSAAAGASGNPDGVIEGAKIATVDLQDRFFIQKPASGNILSADITLSTIDLDGNASTPDATIEANFGFVGVKLETTSQNQQLLTAEAAIPFLQNKITLSSLFGGLGSIANLRAVAGLPTLSTSSDFDLKLSLNPSLDSFLDLPAGANTIHFDITNLGVLQDVMSGSDIVDVSLALPNISVSGVNIGDLANFEDITFTNVVQSLKQISAFLSQFGSFDFLDEEIPLLGQSVNDFLEIADRFAQAVEDFERNPAGGIQALQQKITEAFGMPDFGDPVADPAGYTAALNAYFAALGIPSPGDLIKFSLKDFDGGVAGQDFLRFDLRLPIGFSRALSIDLDLGEALGVDLGPVDIQGGAGLNLKGSLDARLSFGIDLSDPTKIFLFDDSSGIFGALAAGANNLAFNAAIGPMGAFIRDGNVNLNIAFNLDNGSYNAASDNKVALDNLGDIATAFGDFDAELTGTITATLPVYFPTESEYIGDIKLDLSGSNSLTLNGSNGLELPDFSAPGVLTLPDFGSIDLSAINPFGSIPLMLDSLDFLLQGLQDITDGKVFGMELPLIGDQLSSASGFIEDLRQDLLAPIRQYVEQAPQLGQELLQKLLYSLLGPGSAGVTITVPVLGSQPLYQFLGLASDFTGFGLLVDYTTGSQLPADISVADVVATSTDGSDSDTEPDDFMWKFRLADTFSPSVDINFDLGWDALGLAMNTGLDVDITWDLALGLGISKADGAYLAIGDHRANGGTDNEELILSVNVTLPPPADPSQPAIEGRLAFLQLRATPSTLPDPDLEQDDTHFSASFKVDLKEKGATGADAEKLTFSELGSLDAEVKIEADAEVNLDIVVEFNRAILPDTITAMLPSVSTRFVLDWETSNILASEFDFGDSLKLLAFKEVTIDMGSFLRDFLGPVVDKIAEVTEPLEPIIEVITAPIPVISDLAGQPVTLVDIAGLTGYVEPAMIYAIADIIELVNKVHGVDGELSITLGDFALIDIANSIGDGSLADQLSLPTFDLSSDSAGFNLDNALGLSGLGDFVDSATAFLGMLSGSDSSGVKTLTEGLVTGSEAGSSGFAFPIFDDPSSIFGLLLGRNVDLVTYDLAPFKMDFSYTQKFPIWDGLFARITGSAGLTIDLAFGYDTQGVREFADGGFSNPLDLLAGFFVSDTNLGTSDVPELVLRGELFAGAELNLGIASAGAEGGIILTVNFDLYDPDRDGKVRIDELLGNFLYEFNTGNPALAPIAIFDVYGDVAAQLRMFVESAFFKFTFNITPPITLFEFSIDFAREPILATERGDGSLLLHVGPNSAQRLNQDTRDINEKIFVSSVDANTVLVWAPELGVPQNAAQEYKLGENKLIVAYGGEGNDVINASGVAHGISVLLEGGAGDDELHAGQSGGTLKGELGNDKLFGGDAADLIIGGEGSDTIAGGKGADYIFGDNGTLTVDDNETEFVRTDDKAVRIRSLVGEKDGADTIKGDDGDDIIFGGGNIDNIHGNAGNDLIFGDGGSFDFVDGAVPTNGGKIDIAKINARGLGDQDVIYGDAGDDTILAGAGDDFVDGGANDDLVLGGLGFDTLYGGSGADYIYGEDNDDIIFGHRDPVVPSGFTADAGDADADGADYVEGGEGNDFIRGQGAGDILHGNRGADIIFGDEGNDVIGAGILQRPWVTDPALQQTDNEAGADIIFGGADNDIIDAGDAGDIVFGDDGLVAYLGFHVGAIAPFTTTGSRIRTDAAGSDRLIGDGPESLLGGYSSSDDNEPLSMDLIVTSPLASDGSDTIIGGDGKDIVFGGGGALDQLFGDFNPAAAPVGPRPSGQDVLIGDGGRVELSGRRYSAIKTLSNALDGVDQITGNDSGDYIFGGGASDTIWGFENPSFGNSLLSGISDTDVILGDNGQINFNPNESKNRITMIFTTAVVGDSGRSDTIHGNFDNDVILGGLNGSSDILDGGLGDDVILGDQGILYFQDDASTVEIEGDSDLDSLDLIRSFTDGLGGVDIISGGVGSDVLIGGTAGDMMYGDNATASNGSADGEDIMLGDNGDIWLIGASGRLLVQVAAMPAGTGVDIITTTDTAEASGGADTMSGNAKADVMLGGVNNGGIDKLYGDQAAPTAPPIANDGDDVMLGDNGLLDFTFGDSDRSVLDLIRSFEDGMGATDELSGNKGADIAIGGTGADTIHGDDAAATAAANDLGDVLLGDNADIFLVAQGLAVGGDLKLVLGAGIKTIKTTDEENPSYGGVDVISGNANGDIIAGGVQGDTLYGDRQVPTPASIANEANDIILGDNGSLEWLSNGRLTEITGIDISQNNPGLWTKYGAAASDTDLTTLDLITTEQPNSGGRDLIYGDEGNDLIFGGTDSDTIRGDDGNEVPSGAWMNRDVIFGDHGRLYPQFSALPSINSRNFFAIDVNDADGGEGDRIWGEEGDDVLIGQQGDDRIFGGSGDDDLIGGHNVAGGRDELSSAAILATLTSGVNDLLDGGSGDDAMAGDNATIWRRGDDVSPRFRLLTSSTIYSTTSSQITTNVGGAAQSDPENAVGRDIELVDHSDSVQADPQGLFGNDVMAGGADSDVLFGQLGDDIMQGDGILASAPAAAGVISHTIIVADAGSDPDTDETLYFNVPESISDSSDYMEGNGGDDLMFGGLGQDDIIGGSSSLFGLTSEAMRPDGSDTIFGGAGVRIARNDVGDAATLGHSRDADYVMGDNANIFRLVTAADQFRVFAYDNYAGAKIVPRAMQQLDYTLGGSDFAGGSYSNGAANADNGASDIIHGEDGDDIIFGMTGSDVIFGNAQDDDVIGGYGHDWISGGTGQDGVLGDDGLLFTSRNGTAEPLYGIAATSQQIISTPGQIQYAVINPTGELKKSVDIVPFSYDPSWNAIDDEFPDNQDDSPFADDIIFGGLGSDFLHGGSGDDAISGAEALNAAYVPVYDSNGVAVGILNLGYGAISLTNLNPGNVLAFNPIDVEAQHTNNRHRAGEFRLYDEYDALRKILLTPAGELSKDGTGVEFLLNFNQAEGVLREGGTVPKGPAYGAVNDDGADAIFGDNGNDWIVGGTGRDNSYGGWGNDLLNADDDQQTNSTANDVPDTHPTYEDRAYGGAGRDVLIANTGGDRLIDWVGEYNAYLVPFAPFGSATVSRTLQPFLPEFLYALSKADGADQTRPADTGADPLRNGEPNGELGLVLQKDVAWQSQTGAPADPQAGNIPGGKRDVLRSADFNNGAAQGFAADSGAWSVSSGAYQVAPDTAGGDAVSVFYVDEFIPSYFELLATVRAVKPTGGREANAYIVFDYQSPTDFKFAGLNVSTNKLEVGQRTQDGWTVLKQTPFLGQAKSNTDYNLFIALNGSAVTLIVNNHASISYSYAPRVDIYGMIHGLNDGMVGLGARNSMAQIDNVMVQKVAPAVTLNQTVDFSAGPTSLFEAPLTGAWSAADGRFDGAASASAPAIDLVALRVSPSSFLDLKATLSSTGEGGLVFDQYGPEDYKFVTLSMETKQIILGHRTARGWFTDAVFDYSLLTAGVDYTLGLTIKGSTVSVSLNGQTMLSRAYNALVTDGGFGLFSRTGNTSFDALTIQTDDPAFSSL